MIEGQCGRVERFEETLSGYGTLDDWGGYRGSGVFSR